MVDIIEHVGKSTIQHGSYNQRIYLMDLAKSDFPEIIFQLEQLAREKKYSKIFAKVPDWATKKFLKNSYTQEAKIPWLYGECIDGVFLSKFLDPSRKMQSDEEKKKILKVLAAFKQRKKKIVIQNDLKKYQIKQLSDQDIQSLTTLYKIVFQSYPFPIFSPSFIEKTMQNHVQYYGIYHDHELIAASSAEMDERHRCVEMTDFATHPSFRGKNLSFYLLQKMENDVREEKFKTSYTIARAESFGMNCTFGKAGYEYAGTLIHNTNIAGRIESMNVLFKKL